MIAPLLFAIAVAGDWAGTSICTDRKALPGCHDETVVYHLTEPRANVVHIAADKIVDGKPEYMGEFDMTRQGSRLTHEMTDRRGGKSLWDFRVKGDRIDGTLTLLPGGEVVRKIAVVKR
jgi:hypothetical protein